MRDAAGELDHLEAALNVAFGVRKGLAVLGRQKSRERVKFLLRQVEKLHHDTGTPLWVRRRPSRLCRFSHRNRVFDLGVLGEGDLGLNFTGIGVEYVAEPPRSPLHLFTADEVADLTHEVSPFRRWPARAAS